MPRRHPCRPTTRFLRILFIGIEHTLTLRTQDLLLWGVIQREPLKSLTLLLRGSNHQATNLNFSLFHSSFSGRYKHSFVPMLSHCAAPSFCLLVFSKLVNNKNNKRRGGLSWRQLTCAGRSFIVPESISRPSQREEYSTVLTAEPFSKPFPT